jgi:hypothetical protein
MGLSLRSVYIMLLLVLRVAAQSVGTEPPEVNAVFHEVFEQHYKDEKSFPIIGTSQFAFSGRYTKPEVAAFAEIYLPYLNARPGSPERMEAMKKALFPTSEQRLERIRNLCGLPSSVRVKIGLSTDQNETIYSRPSVTPQSYLILFGPDFLERLNSEIISLAGFLESNFQLKTGGYLTYGLALSDLASVTEAVDRALQFSPGNILDSRTSYSTAVQPGLLPGMRPLAATPYLKSPLVPESTKSKIRRSTAQVDVFPDIPNAESVAPRYALNDPYLRALHYYVFRDVLTYLLAHEMGHILVRSGQRPSAGSRRADELAADRFAGEEIYQLEDTDPRSIVLAMSTLHREALDRPEVGQEHPFTPDRYVALFHSLFDSDARFAFDADKGLSLIQTSVSDDGRDSCSKSICYSEGLDHSLRFTVPANVRPQSVAFQLDLYSVGNPDDVKASWHFAGSLPLGGPVEKRDPLDSSHANTSIALVFVPPELWTKCVDCGMRLREFSTTVNQPNARTLVPSESWRTLVARLKALPKDKLEYETYVLARAEWEQERYADAAIGYAALFELAPSMLTAADYVRWARCQISQPAAAAKTLDAALAAYPLEPELWFVDGLMHEAAGGYLTAIDRYFQVAKGFVDALNDKDAGQRLAWMSRFANQDRLVATFFRGYLMFGQAQKALGTPESGGVDNGALASLFRESAQMFESVDEKSPIYVAKFYRAEALLLAALVARRPTDEVAGLMEGLVAERPSFIPPYAHLAHIADCRGDQDAAKRWILRAIAEYPFQDGGSILLRALWIAEAGGARKIGINPCSLR